MAKLLQSNLLALAIGPLDLPTRSAMDETASRDIRHIQWSANHPGMRPRDLDRSARRDLLATLRRRSLGLAGIDLWIPATHFTDSPHNERALEALLGCLVLAEDLGRVPVSTSLPGGDDLTHVRYLIDAEAERRGVIVADHNVDSRLNAGAGIGFGIDPAVLISAGHDPAQAVIAAGSDCKSARLCDLLTSGMRGPIGQPDGQLDVVSYRATLTAIEFDRPIIIDVRQWQDPWTGIDRTVTAWREAMPVL